jgi:hypothetical protein
MCIGNSWRSQKLKPHKNLVPEKDMLPKNESQAYPIKTHAEKPGHIAMPIDKNLDKKFKANY